MEEDFAIMSKSKSQSGLLKGLTFWRLMPFWSDRASHAHHHVPPGPNLPPFLTFQQWSECRQVLLLKVDIFQGVILKPIYPTKLHRIITHLHFEAYCWVKLSWNEWWTSPWVCLKRWAAPKVKINISSEVSLFVGFVETNGKNTDHSFYNSCETVSEFCMNYVDLPLYICCFVYVLLCICLCLERWWWWQLTVCSACSGLPPPLRFLELIDLIH